VKFVSDCIGQEAENAAAALKSGEVIGKLISIVRKKQEVLFRRTISSLGNI
jgi:hypothetical protein